jgi:acyl carrier protein
MRSANDIEGALLREIARILGEPADKLEPSRSLSELGVDSLGYCTVSAFVEKKFGVAVPPEELFEFSSVEATAAHVAGLLAGDKPAASASAPAAAAAPVTGCDGCTVLRAGYRYHRHCLQASGRGQPEPVLGSDSGRSFRDPRVSLRSRARG